MYEGFFVVAVLSLCVVFGFVLLPKRCKNLFGRSDNRRSFHELRPVQADLELEVLDRELEAEDEENITWKANNEMRMKTATAIMG